MIWIKKINRSNKFFSEFEFFLHDVIATNDGNTHQNAENDDDKDDGTKSNNRNMNENMDKNKMASCSEQYGTDHMR